MSARGEEPAMAVGAGGLEASALGAVVAAQSAGSVWRNGLFARQLGAMAAVVAVVAMAAGVLFGIPACGAAAVTGVACCVLFGVFSCRRYREIARLAAEVDEVLHSGRRVSFSDCREGDVSILRTEVSKMVARLARTSEQLRAEKTALADALADISHQIRTPLTAMSLLVPVAERAASDGERRRAIRQLESMVDRVSWLVTALLKLARLDAGVVRVERRKVRVADVAKRALAPLELSLDVRGIDCQVVVGDASFEGDAAWTAEALENIVKNCAEAAGPGGAVRIEAVEDALATRIRISDDGPGIAAEDLPHLFERFYRGSRHAAGASGRALGDAVGSENRREPDGAESCGLAAAGGRGAPDAPDDPADPQGFGIGLSLAQALASAQGATLRARNLPERGACFELAFPKLTV